MGSLKIVGFCVGVAVVYGIVHDQFTAHFCPEYFTIGHPPLLPTEDPTLLGIGWGIAATWWAGLLLGIPTACAAQAGRLPVKTVRDLIFPVGILLLVMAASAITAGAAGWALAGRGIVRLDGPIAFANSDTIHRRFIADLWAHNASYFVGFFGGSVVIGIVLRSRYLGWKHASMTADDTRASLGEK